MQIFAHLDISKKKGTKYRQAEGENSKKLLTVIDVDIAAVVADQPNPISAPITIPNWEQSSPQSDNCRHFK